MRREIRAASRNHLGSSLAILFPPVPTALRVTDSNNVVRTARAATMPGRFAVEGRREDSANLRAGRVQCRCNYTRVEAGARRYAVSVSPIRGKWLDSRGSIVDGTRNYRASSCYRAVLRSLKNLEETASMYHSSLLLIERWNGEVLFETWLMLRVVIINLSWTARKTSIIQKESKTGTSTKRSR